MALNKWKSALRPFLGIRVIKTAAATLLAILTATALELDNPAAAGILAIIGVETTRWRGFRIVASKFGAALIGLMVASALFYLFGFYIWVLSIYVIVAFPILVRVGLKEGTITGAMVVFQLFMKQELSWTSLGSVVLLLVIGLGWATVLNVLYMPKETDKLIERRRETEDSLAAIFGHLAAFLRDPDTIWSGEEVLRAEDAIVKGLETARRARENRWIPADEPWELYFTMRREQMDSVKLMIASVAMVSSKVPQADMIAQLFDRLKEDVKSEYYEGATEAMLDELERTFRVMPLPVTRDEFETRSALWQLCRELRRYLTIAKRSKKRKTSSDLAVI